MGIKKSFTLIEMIVVVGVVSITMPIIFSIIFLILRQQIQLYGLQEAKKQGDSAMVIMKGIIRNHAKSIYENQTDADNGTNAICENQTLTSLSSSYFRDDDSIPFGFALKPIALGNDYIASYSAILTPDTEIPLTNQKVIVTDFEMRCRRENIFSPPLVSINFNIKYAGFPNKLNYRANVRLRNE